MSKQARQRRLSTPPPAPPAPPTPPAPLTIPVGVDAFRLLGQAEVEKAQLREALDTLGKQFNALAEVHAACIRKQGVETPGL